MTEPEDTAFLDELEAHCDLLAEQLDAVSHLLHDLLDALDDVDRQPTEVTRRHLDAVRRDARRVLREAPTEAAQVEIGLSFLGQLMIDYMETTADPEQFFGPGAPDPRNTLAAAIRWAVSEGRLTLDQAEQMQKYLHRP